MTQSAARVLLDLGASPLMLTVVSKAVALWFADGQAARHLSAEDLTAAIGTALLAYSDELGKLAPKRLAK